MIKAGYALGWAYLVILKSQPNGFSVRFTLSVPVSKNQDANSKNTQFKILQWGLTNRWHPFFYMYSICIVVYATNQSGNRSPYISCVASRYLLHNLVIAHQWPLIKQKTCDWNPLEVMFFCFSRKYIKNTISFLIYRGFCLL